MQNLPRQADDNMGTTSELLSLARLTETSEFFATLSEYYFKRHTALYHVFLAV